MKKARRSGLIAVILVLAMIAAAFVVMVVKNTPYGSSMKFGIFDDIGELAALEKYAADGEEPEKDAALKNLEPKEAWVRVLNVDGSKCTVRAYVFGSQEDAAEYYKKAANRTKVNEGANGSASAGGLFGPARYVTVNDRNVLVITGKSLAEISKALDAFFEADPGALSPFEKKQ